MFAVEMNQTVVEIPNGCPLRTALGFFETIINDKRLLRWFQECPEDGQTSVSVIQLPEKVWAAMIAQFNKSEEEPAMVILVQETTVQPE